VVWVADLNWGFIPLYIGTVIVFELRKKDNGNILSLGSPIQYSSNLVIRGKRRLNRHVFGRRYGIEQDPQRCDWSWLGLVKVSDPDCVLKFGRSFGNVNVHAPIIHFSNIKKGGIVGTRADIPGDTFQSLIHGHIVHKYKIAKDPNAN